MRSKNRINLRRFSLASPLLVGIVALAVGVLSLATTGASAKTTTSGSQTFLAARSTTGTTPESVSSSVNLAPPREERHTFKLHHDGAAIVETCTGYVDIGKSTSYPGFIQGRAWIESCTPEPAEFCSQTADMQTYDKYSHTWVADGDGTPKYGCAGETDAGTITKNCKSTSETFYYRTVGIFVAIDSLGDKLVWGGPSGQIGVLRVC